jgi:hypothetical protein
MSLEGDLNNQKVGDPSILVSGLEYHAAPGGWVVLSPLATVFIPKEKDPAAPDGDKSIFPDGIPPVTCQQK